MFVFVKRLNTHMHMCIYVTTGTKRTSISQEKNLHGAVIMSVLFCFFFGLVFILGREMWEEVL